MPPIKLSSSASRLLDHQRLRGRAFPTQKYWDRFYQLLEEEAERRGKTPPPPPMTHALDHEPTDEDKMERLAEQVAWADRNQLLHRVQEFFDRMPTSCWVRSEKRH
jgi:hypothetical protein